MTLWVCSACSTRYSVGAPSCPHCGRKRHYEEGDDVPRNTVDTGTSHEDAGVKADGAQPEAPQETAPAPEPEATREAAGEPTSDVETPQGDEAGAAEGDDGSQVEGSDEAPKAPPSRTSRRKGA
jgi:hypothetical protein